MLLKFLNEFKCTPENTKNNFDWKICCCNCLTMKRNMLNFMKSQGLDPKEKVLSKSNSQKYLEILKKGKKENKIEQIVKNQYDINYLPEEKNKINENISIGDIIITKIEKNNNKKDIDSTNINKEENNNKNILNIPKNVIENQNEKDINQNNKNNLELNIEDINDDIKFDNFENNIQNEKNISFNPIANFLGIENNLSSSPLNQIDNLSETSSNNNSKINKNRISVHSSNSFGKNFILKSEVYKSTKQKDFFNKKINYSDNPINNYYSGKYLDRFANFYIANIKSPEYIDDNHYMNFFPNKSDKESNTNKEKEYNNNTTLDNKKKDSPKESYNDIFEWENIEEKSKDPIEGKMNIDETNSKIIENNLMINNNIEDIKNIINENNNIKYKSFNENNNQKSIFDNNNINSNDFTFPLSQVNNNINNNNNNTYIDFSANNINSFSINNNNMNMNNISNMSNGNLFNFEINNNNNNNLFNVNNTKNLREFKLSKEILSEISNIDIDKINLPSQETNNYFMKMPYQNENPNLAFSYITYNTNKEKVSSGLPSNKTLYEYSDDDILKYAIPLIKDQSGCRFLQEKLRSSQTFMVEKLFPLIQNNLFELGCDAFGNYFLQALIDIFPYEKLDILLDLIKNDLINMCINQFGTRVVQKIIDKISFDKALSSKLGNILDSKDIGIVMKSPYGNHILQKFLETIHFNELTKFIYEYIIKNFLEIAETKHGVCVIQKCVSEGDVNQRNLIYNLILQNFNILIKDEFGNYLLQYILLNVKSKEKFNEITPIMQKIDENLLDICKCKFSANVIEKCFENGSNFIKEYFLECLLNKYKNHIIEILLDQYGIYIIQKAIKLNDLYRKRFYEIIKEKKKELRNIDLNDFKYRGVQKVLDSFKDLDNTKYINSNNMNNNFNNMNYNYNNYRHNNNNSNDYRNNFNNKRKNKRGKKNNRGK